jgi:DNA-binding response OmpR family regulator
VIAGCGNGRTCQSWCSPPATERRRRSRRGADDYVNKPFSVGELITRLRTALRHHLLRQGETPAVKVGDLEETA